MDNGQKSLKNGIYGLISYGITIAFGLLIPRLFVVHYGSEVNGLIGSLSQLMVYLNLLEAGVGTAALQALYQPVARDDWKKINGILSATDLFYRRAGLWYLICLLGLSVGYPILVDSSLPFLTVAGVVFFSGAGNVVLFWFQGKYRFLLQADGRLYVLTGLTTLTFVMTSLAKAVLIWLRADIVLIMAAAFAVQCLQAGYLLWYVRRYRRLDLKAEPDREAISQKNAVVIHQISTLIFRNTDVLLLTIFTDLKVVSVYTMYRLVTTQLETILAIPVNSVSFILGQNYQDDRPLYIRRIDVLESLYGGMVHGLYAVALYLFLPFMALYTAGVTDINYVDPALAVLFVLVALLDRSRTLMLLTIDYAGHFRSTVPHTLLEAGINLGVSLVAVQIWGIYGVLLGTAAALTYRANDIILYANHRLLKRSARRTYGIHGVCLLMFAASLAVFHVWFHSVVICSWSDFFTVGLIAAVISLSFQFLGQLIFSHVRSFAGLCIRRVFR